MKKIILGISVIGVLVANADMSAQEKAFASGIGTGYANEIRMYNPNFMKEDLFNLCSSKVNTNYLMNNRGNESVAFATNECVSQLKIINQTKK